MPLVNPDPSVDQASAEYLGNNGAFTYSGADDQTEKRPSSYTPLRERRANWAVENAMLSPLEFLSHGGRMSKQVFSASGLADRGECNENAAFLTLFQRTTDCKWLMHLPLPV